MLAGMVALGFGWTGAQAMWARMTDAELVAESALIVLGRVAEMRVGEGPDTAPRTVGVLAIEAVVKGAPDMVEVLIAVPQPGAPLSSTDLVIREGQDGLWVLRAIDGDGDATHAADHPQRFVPRPEAASRVEELRSLLAP